MHPREFSLEGFPFYFSVAIYCFEGAGMILSLEESLASEVGLIIVQYAKCTQAIFMCGVDYQIDICTFVVQIRDQFKSYFIKTILAITTLYITFGVAGYLSYG